MTITPHDERLVEQMGTGVLPQLPAEVYEDRFARCRALMAERGLEVLIVYSGAMPFQACEWARYFANYLHPYWNGEAFIVIPREGDPALLINYGFMLDVARETSPIKDVRSPVERFGAASRYAGLDEALKQILAERGVSNGPVGLSFSGGQGDWAPGPLRPLFEELLAGVEVHDAADLLTALILKKTAFDLELTRAASVIASDGMQAAFDAMEEGARESDAYLAFQRAVIEAGADSPLFHYISQSGPSAHIALRPLAATGRRLKRGDLFLIDAGICFQGYYADITRTAAISELSEAGRRLYRATEEVVEEMVSELRPGVRAGRIAEILFTGIEKRGYTRTHPLIGHGIGTFVNEPPFVMPWNEFVIEEDMVINLEPAIYDPEVGGVRIEDPYLITPTGAERLTTVPQECHIA
ncbi:MAG TPA: Xaa-Pro peptidase family protein [Gaiellaceae bacterium]|nr:Xaa-Pro peptidase family protein [Gaiellaceae bacterium]